MAKQKARFAPVGSPEWKRELAVARKRMPKNQEKNAPMCGDVGGYRRTDGLPCGSPYVLENGLCRRHGGKVAKGLAHANFTTGRGSRVFKHLPERFHAAFQASITDDDLLSMRTDISISDARIEELLTRLDTGESKLRWKEISELQARMVDALSAAPPDTDDLRDLAEQLRHLTVQNRQDEDQWEAIRSQTNFRKNLVDAERARLKDIHAFITAEDALVVVMRLVDVIVRHVEDPSALNAIMTEVEVLTKDPTP